jgi:hypothetical protein
MARCTVPFFAQNGNSTTLPLASLFAIAGQDLVLREVGVFNDGVVAVTTKLVKCTAAGTPGTGLTEANVDFTNHTILGTGFQKHSVAPTLGADVAPMPVGAAIGAGTILTWYGERNGLLIPAGTANGVAILQLAAVSQALSGYFIWDE